MLSDEDLNLAASYALGLLDESRLLHVEARLAAGDTGLRRAITEFSDATSPMTERPAPSASLRQRLVASACRPRRAAAAHGRRDARAARAAAPAAAPPAAPASAAAASPASAAPATKVVTIAAHRGLERLAPASAAAAGARCCCCPRCCSNG